MQVFKWFAHYIWTHKILLLLLLKFTMRHISRTSPIICAYIQIVIKLWKNMKEDFSDSLTQINSMIAVILQCHVHLLLYFLPWYDMQCLHVIMLQLILKLLNLIWTQCHNMDESRATPIWNKTKIFYFITWLFKLCYFRIVFLSTNYVL